MTKKFTISIRFYGPFRDYFPDDMINIALDSKTSLADLTLQLIKTIRNDYPQFDKIDLISFCVFSDDENIIQHHAILDKDSELFLLPPVAGG